MGHVTVKHEIEVCNGTGIQKGGIGSYPACNTTDNGPNVEVSFPSLEMSNTKIVHTTLTVDENFCKAAASTFAIVKG